MSRKISLLNVYAKAVVALRLETLIDDRCTLAVALYFSSPDQTAYILDEYPEKSECYQAAKLTYRLHADDFYRMIHINAGFFRCHIDRLMVLAREDAETGARLAPVFYKIAEHAKAHLVSEKQVEEINALLEEMRERDGFSIRHIEEGDAIVFPANDVSIE